MRATLVAAAFAAVAPRASAAPDTQPTTVPATQPALTPEQDLRRYMDRLSTTLSQGTQAQRDDAAQRLLSIGNLQTKALVTQALQSTDDKAQLACARAIAEGQVTDPRWVTPLVQMVARDGFYDVEAAARALARFDGDPRTYEPLIAIAKSRQQPASRPPVIRAMGLIVQKPVAQALIGLVNDAGEDLPIRTAAADALQEISGQSGIGPDAKAWTAWWQARLPKGPPEWREQVLAEQHPVLERGSDQAREQLRQFKLRMQVILAGEYDRQPMADKPKLLLNFLNDTDPNVREIGAGLVSTAVAYGQPVTQEIHARLIDLVGDANPDVRKVATDTLSTLADAKALPAIVRQLQVERSNAVKISLLRALARIGSPAEIPVVMRILKDGPPDLSAEAARTIRALSTGMEGNGAKALFDELRQVLEGRTGLAGMPNAQPGTNELRAALLGAMARVARSDPQASLGFFEEFVGVNGQNESSRVRQAALQGLAVLGERAGDVIAAQLDPNNEPDRSVRQAAATALGDVGSFNYANNLERSMRPQNEPDQLVRDSAAKAFFALVPAGSPRELSQYADIFRRKNEPDREVAVRRELEKKLKAANDVQSLPIEQERIGELYLQNLKQPGEAVP
ncbi:MAG TPA: HEAT repeat domain-containing protein, partial [Tepidisphaeraceae bacterium]|nr:HEAT repeat domain-containing protein [Tepidisphaeraceae bacterium]